MGNDGNTYQKVDCARPAMRSASPVSRQSQTMPSRETSGSETTSAPNAGLRFAITDTTATMMPDSAHLTTKYSMRA
jgi:hypothetical protein